MTAKQKAKLRRAGNRTGKSDTAINTMAPLEYRPRKVTQADVDAAAKRSDIEELAVRIAATANAVSDYRSDLDRTEKQLTYLRQQLSESMLNHTKLSNELEAKLAIPQPVV